MTDFVTEQMENALVALQTVKGLDYDAAYRAAYGGIHGFDPRHKSVAEMIHGRSLALHLWAERQTIRVAA